MGAWTWLLLLVFGLAVVQLVVYRRLQAGTTGRERSDAGDTELDVDWGIERHYPGDDLTARPAGRERGADEWVCPHCGAHNEADQAYTYCHDCVRRLR